MERERGGRGGRGIAHGGVVGLVGFCEFHYITNMGMNGNEMLKRT